MNRNQLQQKRQLFRINIRRKQLQEKFTSIRTQYIKSQLSLHKMTALVHSNCFFFIKEKLHQFFYDITQQISQRNYRRCISILQRLHNLIIQQRSNFLASQKSTNEDQQQKWKQLLTIVVNQAFQPFSRNLTQLIMSLFQQKEPSESDEDQDEMMLYVTKKKLQKKNPEREQISEEDTILIYRNIFSVLSYTYPNLLQFDLCEKIIHLLWKVWKSFQLVCNKEQSYYEVDRIKSFHLQFLLVFLNFTLCSMESRGDEKKIHIFQHTLSIGIVQEMRHIIQYIIDLSGQQEDNVHAQTIELMIQQVHIKITQFLLLFYRQRNQSNSESSFQQYLYEHFASYGLYLLNYLYKKKMLMSNLNQSGQSSRQLLLNSIYLLINIQSLNEQITSSIDLANFGLLQNIMEQEMRMRWNDPYSHNIIIGILGIFSLVTEEGTVMKKLVLSYNLIEFLDSCFVNLLNLFSTQVSFPPNRRCPLVTKSLNMVSNIICNIFKGASKSIKKCLQTHHFLKMLFNEIPKDPQKLFPLMRIFPFYFLSMGKKATFNNLHIMLEAVSNMNLQDQTDESLEIHSIVKTVYLNCKGYIGQEEMTRIQGIYQAYGLNYFIDDFQ